MSKTDNVLQMRKADGNLTLYADQSPIFSYRYETMFPPRGVDPLFKRSGFIHPLWSPKGKYSRVCSRRITIIIMVSGDPGR